MVMKCDDSSRIGLENHADHLARVDRCAVDRAAEEDLRADETVAIVEQQDSEDFVRQGADLMPQVLPGTVRTVERRRAGPEALRHQGCGAVEDVLGRGLAEGLAVADKERVSHGRELQKVKLPTSWTHGAQGRTGKRSWNKWRGPVARDQPSLRQPIRAPRGGGRLCRESAWPGGRAVRAFQAGYFRRWRSDGSALGSRRRGP